MSAQRIIDGLKDAVAGNLARVTIDGQVWTRGEPWQPIETAPKDGTFVLLWSPDGESNPWFGQWRDDSRMPDGGAWWQDNEGGFPVDADPQHWMPRPEAPVVDLATRSPDARAG